VIKGYADILRKGMAGQVNEEQVDYLSTINHNVRRMNTFIKDLSDQAHIETKSLRLDFEPTPVLEVFNEVLHSYEAQVKKNSLKINLHIPADIPDVWCDRQRLIQILANLFSNAVKYSPEGQSISVGAEQSANICDEKGTAEVVHFWVEDNGYGISTEDQAHLFEKFYRGSDLRIKKIPGTGLGLRISKSLVEMMGGKMWFDSAIDEGSTFHFTLPI
jgi:signal transduction histidine kinase